MLDEAKNALARLTLRAINGSLALSRDLLFLRRRAPSLPARIAVFLVGNVGDVVVATPALIALRHRYPRSHVTLITSAGKRGGIGARSLLEGAPFIDELVEYSTDDIAGAGWMNLLSTVRGLAPDLIVFLPSSLIPIKSLFRNLLFARLTSAAFTSGLEAASAPLFELAQARRMGMFPSEVDRLLGAIGELGVDGRAPAFLFPPPPDTESRQVAELVRAGAFFAVCPGGKQQGHLWPPDRFAALAKRIVEDYGLRLVTIGGPAERELCQTIADAAHGTNLAGVLSLRGTTELLASAELLVTNDTGPMHLAAAVGTPVAAIFGSRDFAGRWYPYGAGHEVFRADLACPTCLFAERITDHCVRAISIEQVLAGCRRILNGRRRQSRAQSQTQPADQRPGSSRDRSSG